MPGATAGGRRGRSAAVSPVQGPEGAAEPARSWWSATDARHVGDESWLERDQVMRLDWDQAMTGIASQPFRLRWTARVCRYFRSVVLEGRSDRASTASARRPA